MTIRGLHLHCCCELVRTKEQRSTFGTFIPHLETETTVLETMTFSKVSLKGLRASIVVNLSHRLVIGSYLGDVLVSGSLLP